MTTDRAGDARSSNVIAAGPATTAAPASAPDESGRPSSAGWETGGLRRFSALDGIRALAVLAVLFYHAGISWLGGGLLGVDVFFVLSGFLITSLLCRELARSSTIRLGRFWAQRARRLLPALLILILGVALYCALFRNTIDVGAIRGDALSTLFYVANWHFILSDQGYFVQSAAPSPLLHTWSLAVEEQFYLVWPLVALFVVRRWGARALALTAVAGSCASALVMFVLFEVGVSVDRLYYGTDTRAQSLMVGAFLGAIGAHAGDGFSILPRRWTQTRRVPMVCTACGVAGAVYLAWAWHALAGLDPFLYRGGFLMVAVATGAVIVACVSAPESWLTRLLSVPALVFVGRISYGLYLYHWPIFLALDHAHTGLTGVALLALRLAAAFAVATASFFLVEEPIRRGRPFRGRLGLGLAGAATLGTAVVVLVATIAPAAEAFAVPRRAGLSDAESRALSAAGAFSTHPVRFYLVGDSVALTFGVGLLVDSVDRYGVRIIDRGAFGCDLDRVPLRVSGQVSPPIPGCMHWAATWSSGVTRFRPDVVGLLIGRWEVTDHLYQDHWVHVGQPSWDRHLTAELNHAVSVLGTGGAKVVLFTMPYVDPSTEAPNGTPFSENNPARARAFNRLLANVAAAHTGVVTLVDLNKVLDPHGQFQAVINGVRVRNADGIHLTKPGGEWLQPSILPTIAALGLEVRSR